MVSSKFKFFAIIALVMLFSCKDDDSSSIEPLRDYAVQYAVDIAKIENFLKEYYITVQNAPGSVTDQDVTFTKIAAGGTQTAIWDMPNLTFRTVKLHGIEYKLYYLKLRDGVGNSPTNVDAVLTSYSGKRIYTTAENVDNLIDFETVKYPQSMMNLSSLIKGWSEVFPQFKAGVFSENSDGSVNYNDFGAGVIFIPSGLGYYGSSRTNLPAYSPLIFSVKLYAVQYVDHDGDRILSHLEDLDFDKYMYTFDSGVLNPDDTDNDGIPNFLDSDDDGDGILTKNELNLDSSGNPILPHPDCDGDGIPDYLDADPCP
jgi:hypothetical protein